MYPTGLFAGNLKYFLNATEITLKSFFINFSTRISFEYRREYDNVTPELAYLIDNNIKGLVYSGDTDMAVNFLGNDWDLQTMDLEVRKIVQCYNYYNKIFLLIIFLR